MSAIHNRPALRSRAWFNNPADPDMTALCFERYLNFGLSLEELQSRRPIIGMAQSGSDLAPGNRHHLVLAERVKEGNWSPLGSRFCKVTCLTRPS
jgi:dihydroxy-acid dehydratase